MTPAGRPLAGLLALVTLASAGAPAALAEDPVEVRSTGGRLSVTIAEETPLAEVLERIGRAVGAEVRIHGDLGAVPPRTIEGVPPGEAVRRLVGRHSLAIIHRAKRGRRGAPALVSISVYEHRPPGGAASGPAAPVRPAAEPPAVQEGDAAERRVVAEREVIRLSYRRDPTAIVQLRQLLASAQDEATRGHAASALVGVGSPEALDAVTRFGLADRSPEVRLRSAYGLWQARGEAARPALTRALAKEGDEATRQALEAILAGRPRPDRSQEAAKARVAR